MKPEMTLEEMITMEQEFLVNKKSSADANIAKLTQRASDATGDEKTRLESLVELHVNYRQELDSYDAVAKATERFNNLPKLPTLPPLPTPTPTLP
jgi:hypothetical protein